MGVTASEVDGLEKMRDQASSVQHLAATAYQQRLDQLYKEARQQIESEHVGIEYRTAQDAYRLADAAYRRASHELRVSIAEQRLPYPEGTRMVEWRVKDYRHDAQKQKTKKIGVLQVYRVGDQHPIGMRWKMDPGMIIVRHLKRNGTQSKTFERFNRGNWIPEGEEPKTKGQS